jgi:hypothetical protein
MPKKNKIYWSLGVTEKGTKALLTDENSKFRWLRSQRNRRALVVVYTLALILVSLSSYYTMLKTSLDLSSETEILGFSFSIIVLLLLTVTCYSLLRIAVRGISEAPDELLDERQIHVRNSSYRYAYLGLSWVILVVLLLTIVGPDLNLFQSEGNDGSFLMIAAMFAVSSAPAMVLAWQEKDI